MKKLILHIGMHKTGTTSLQKIFSSSQHVLNKSNIFYADLNKFNTANSFYVMFLDNPTEHISFKNREIHDLHKAKDEQEKLMQLWRKEFENFSNGYYIISDEELSYLPLNGVIKMRNFLVEYFNDITVIMYAREPISFIPSIINEHIKYGATKIRNRTFSSITYYINRIAKYVKAFGRGNIIIRSFDKKHMKNNDLFEDFFYSLNIKFDASKLNTIVENQSLGHNALTFLLEYNKKFPRFIGGEINKERGLAFRINIFFELLQKINDKKFTLDLKFTNKEANAINKEISYVNQFLPEENKFLKVETSQGITKEPDPEDIPLGFFIELVNEYNKKIDSLIDKNAELIKQNKRKNDLIKKMKEDRKD